MKYVLFLISVLMVSCTGSTIYRENAEISKEGWSKKNPITFEPQITDNKTIYNTFVVVRHNGQYKFNNLWLFITISDPSGKSKTDTVECILADEKGKWYGDGLSDLKTLKLSYRSNITFPDTGIYKFSIEQAMREEPLENITDVAFAIEKAEK